MPEPEVLDLSDLLQSISGGDFHVNATRKLAKLVETMHAVARNAGGAPKGKLAISISFKLDRGVMEIDADAKVVEPATVRGRTILWATEQGGLVREDPRQGSLALTAGEEQGHVRPINRKATNV